MPLPAETKRQRAPVDVFKFRDYREFLTAFYAAKKPSGLSYRAFAKAAGGGAPNYLKLVIEGKRNLSASMALRYAKACRLNEDATRYFETLVAFNQAKSDEARNALHERLLGFARFRTSQPLALAQKDYHSSWYIPAIRELVACEGFVEDPKWIASAMVPSISVKQATQALEVLQRLELTERDESGRLRQTCRAVATGEHAPGLHIRNYHTEMIQGGLRALHELPTEERYISALTLSVGPRTLEEVRKRTLAYRQDLVALCDADPKPEQVVQLNLQLFPLSRSGKTPSKNKSQ